MGSIPAHRCAIGFESRLVAISSNPCRTLSVILPTSSLPPLSMATRSIAHTAGQWYIKETVEFGSVIRSKDEKDLWIASVNSSHDGHASFPTDREGLANARLIAAAPELLAACKDALAGLESWIHSEFDGTRQLKQQLEDLAPLRTAIAKAEQA